MTDTITLPREVAERILRNIEIGNALSAGIEMRREIEAALEQPQSPYGECDECGTPYSYDPTDGGCICVRCMKEKLATKQSQVEQEPVAYYVMNGAALFQLFRSKSQADALVYDLQKRHDLSGSLAHFHVVPLYTHPHPPRQPLTDEQQIAEAMRRHGLVLVKTVNGYDVLKLGQITAHGIGGEA